MDMIVTKGTEAHEKVLLRCYVLIFVLLRRNCLIYQAKDLLL